MLIKQLENNHEWLYYILLFMTNFYLKLDLWDYFLYFVHQNVAVDTLQKSRKGDRAQRVMK